MAKIPITLIMFQEKQEQLQRLGQIDLMVRVRPHAARTQVIGVLADGSIKMDIAAPAEDNRGNIALLHALAEEFLVPVAQVKILSGKTARLKLVRIRSASL